MTKILFGIIVYCMCQYQIYHKMGRIGIADVNWERICGQIAIFVILNK